MKVQKFLKVARSRGAVINTSIAIATASGFIKRSNDEPLKHLPLERPWAQNLFRQMGYVRRFATTGKVKLPQDVKREAELLYIHDIVNLIETHKIPKSMVVNLDQTPVKYVPCPAGLPSQDPFDEVDPIVEGRKEILVYDLITALSINKDRLVEGCTTVQGEDGDDSEWEDPNDDGCALDLFDDDE